MSRSVILTLYVLAMIVVIVGVDVMFFRGHLWDRLAVNIAIVPLYKTFDTLMHLNLENGASDTTLSAAHSFDPSVISSITPAAAPCANIWPLSTMRPSAPPAR